MLDITRVYVKRLPRACQDCHIFFIDLGMHTAAPGRYGCQLNTVPNKWIDNPLVRDPDCPLIVEDFGNPPSPLPI